MGVGETTVGARARCSRQCGRAETVVCEDGGRARGERTGEGESKSSGDQNTNKHKQTNKLVIIIIINHVASGEWR